MIDRTCEDKCYRTPKFTGAMHYNVPTGCATLLCCACGEQTVCVSAKYPTLRRGREMGAHCAPLRKKESSVVPLFRSGRRSPIFARLGIKETGFTRVETLVSTLVPTAVGTAIHFIHRTFHRLSGDNLVHKVDNFLYTPLQAAVYLGFSTTHCNIGCGKTTAA